MERERKARFIQQGWHRNILNTKRRRNAIAPFIMIFVEKETEESDKIEVEKDGKKKGKVTNTKEEGTESNSTGKYEVA